MDAPEWLLREVASLSRMTYVRIKLLIMHILNTQIGTATLDMEKVKKLVSTAEFDASDIRGAIAAVEFILRGAAQYNVQPEGLGTELNQIGLPAEHSRAFWKAYATHAPSSLNAQRSRSDQGRTEISFLSFPFPFFFVLSFSPLHTIKPLLAC